MTDEEKYCKAKELMVIGKKDRRTAKKILSEMPNYPPAQFLLAVLLKGNKKHNNKKVMRLFSSALPYYCNTTENDEAERQARLAGYYYFGDMGLKKNLSEAVKWFSFAANSGDSKSQLFLARCYATGCGTDQNIEKSIYWIEKAAEQNDPEALAVLGHSYVTGQGVNKDLEKGVELLKKAIDLGNKKALKLYRYLVLTKTIRT